MPITLIKLYELNKNPPALLEAMQEWNLIPRVGGYCRESDSNFSKFI